MTESARLPVTARWLRAALLSYHRPVLTGPRGGPRYTGRDEAEEEMNEMGMEEGVEGSHQIQMGMQVILAG